jgi:hypothetical protein
MFLLSRFVRIYTLVLSAVLMFQVGGETAPYRVSQQAEPAEGVPKVSLIIWTDRAQYSLHEEMKINAALRNNGNAAGYVDRRLHWGGLAGGFKLEIRNEQGKALPASLESDAPMPPPKEGDTSILIKLEPGFLYGSHVQLDVKDFFPKPGRYSLRVAYGSSLMKELVVPQFRDLPALWRDSPIIISEPVWITITSTGHRVRR